jgi:hypothetical protein
MNPQIMQPASRLAGVVDNDRGVLTGDLAAHADARVALLADNIRRYVRDLLAGLLPHSNSTDAVILYQLPSIGQAASDIADVAGAARLRIIGEICRGIGAMVATHQTTGACHIGALRLHLSTLRLIDFDHGDRMAGGDALLDQLRAMRAAIGTIE